MSRPGKEERRGRALEREAFLARRLGSFDQGEVEAAAATMRAAPRTGPRGVVPKGFPTGDAQRWVPIGPSVVRRGQANDRPRVVGRIRDLAVHPDGSRAYAASGQGGVWFTPDGGATWQPVGGWAEFVAGTGGDNNAQSCGCLLVDFGATSADDFVMVGTGENTPFPRPTGHGAYGGLGVLAASGPAVAAVGDNPWEPIRPADRALFEGLGMCAMARRPARVAGSSAAGAEDQVLAGASDGLFLGTRRRVGGVDEFQWSRVAELDTLVGGPPAPEVTDVLWLPGGRIVVAVAGAGVAFANGLASPFAWLNGCSPLPAPGSNVQGYSSLALAPGSNRLYVLTGLPPTVAGAADTPSLFQVADITAAAPAAAPVPGVPANLWGAQRDYDQALAVDVVGGADRVYLGGSTVLGAEEWVASLWCFDVVTAPALGLTPAPGVSRTGAPAPPPPPPPPAGAGDGADTAGLVGNNVHADVHTIRIAGPAGARHVWVGCDGGVYVSTRDGRVNSFAPRATGLAVLQPGFVAAHPTSSHFVAAGFQDNGSQVRSGDTMWEAVLTGDGGGTVFHPTRSQYIVTQATRAAWRAVPANGYTRPTVRVGTFFAHPVDRENAAGNALFYSGAAATTTTDEPRIALGTARVWMTGNLGVTNPNRWRVLPWSAAPATAAATDPRPGGTDPAAQQSVGVPTLAPGDITAAGVGPLGQVVTVKWVTATSLLVLFEFGVVRWDEAPPGRWTATALLTPAADPALSAQGRTTFLTDLAPVPGTQDFYLSCTGDTGNPALDTLYRFDAGAGALAGTGLRQALVPPGSPAGTVGALEPAYAVVVDQPPGGGAAQVYVGTVTGAWRRAHNPPAGTRWTRFVNGLPQAAVQDLSLWTDPAGGAGAPRLLRAAVQARGVWEVDLAADEPQRTYLRVHQRDDRRRFPTPMGNPRRRPGAPVERVHASPDVVVRPRAGAGIAPRWLLGGGRIDQANVHAYQLWTFQTAFRWLYPSVTPHGMWSDAFGDLVELHRSVLQPTLGAPPLPLGRFIDRRLWDAVVGGTRVDPATGAPSGNAAHPLAVYRQPWSTPTARDLPATEVDLLENVQPRSVLNDVWRVHSEPSTVDVLLHHRDSRQVPAGDAFAILLWRSGPGDTALLSSSADTIVGFAQAVAAGNPAATPAGWTLVGNATGGPLHSLPIALDARLPRAVSVDVDLSGVPANHRVLFLAIAGSTVDRCTAAPVGLPAAGADVRDLVRSWPHAGLRLVQVNPRP